MASKRIDVDAMQRAADGACGLMKTLANPDRLLLLCQLAHSGEMSVGQLEDALDIRQPTLSQQLTVLRDDELVETRREGKYIYYRVRPGPALALVQALYEQFCGKGKKR
jgi:DNA-binding transcriptional ArsR family regulator